MLKCTVRATNQALSRLGRSSKRRQQPHLTHCVLRQQQAWAGGAAAQQAAALQAAQQAAAQQAAAVPPRWTSGGQAAGGGHAQGMRREQSGSSLHSLPNSIASHVRPPNPLAAHAAP